MSDWAQDIAVAEATAQTRQAAEHEAEGRFDRVHEQAKAAGTLDRAVESEEFGQWMAARHATDEAWGAWSTVMDAKPKD